MADGTDNTVLKLPLVSGGGESPARAPLYERMAAARIDVGILVECVYGRRRKMPARMPSGLWWHPAPPFYFKQPTEDGVYR